jgi:hypothetical protein
MAKRAALPRAKARRIDALSCGVDRKNKRYKLGKNGRISVPGRGHVSKAASHCPRRKGAAMSNCAAPVIDIDWATFDPWRIQPLRHNLTGHPLLEAAQLVELGKRCRGTSRWLSFSNQARAETNLNEAARLFPSHRSAVDSLRSIGDAKAWVLLRHIQEDPLYRNLVSQALDSVQHEVERKDPGMYYRAGWIFSASPQTTTPFHIDRSHVMLLQISGIKTVYVWDASDRTVVSERARDCFHTRHDLSLAQWQEHFRERAHAFELGPGMGVYMPLTSPHMVETSQEASTTISFTYNTLATRRIARMHVMRDALHRLGLKPPEIGTRASFDRLAALGAAAMIALHGPGSRAPACPSLSHRRHYAAAD